MNLLIGLILALNVMIHIYIDLIKEQIFPLVFDLRRIKIVILFIKMVIDIYVMSVKKDIHLMKLINVN